MIGKVLHTAFRHQRETGKYKRMNKHNHLIKSDAKSFFFLIKISASFLVMAQGHYISALHS